MEITQYLQYKVVDQCDNKINQYLTMFTWVLEWIQPLMWNIIYFYITKSNKEVFKFCIALSVMVFIAGMLRVFNFSDKKSVTHELQVKGRNCTISGDKHLAWNNNAQTFYGLEPNWFVYLMLWFIPILWVTPFKLGLQIFIFNVSLLLLTIFIIGRIDDQLASTWCLLSIPGIAAGELLRNTEII
tara:strand:+ start:225 stop:779 length:555 start_codon:yes stop_codon:yes gene_type:complete